MKRYSPYYRKITRAYKKYLRQIGPQTITLIASSTGLEIINDELYLSLCKGEI
jgi:hypothetical protein